jgi:superfamily II DNA or RNA helicase
MLFEEVSKHWDKTVIATGDYSHKANNEATAKIESGEATVLICTGALLAEGFDVRKLDREFIVLPLSGQGTLLEQYIGRVQRTCENKENAVIFDYVDDIGILRNQYRRRMLVYSHLGIKERKNT